MDASVEKGKSMFALHEALANDTVEIVRWPICRVLLMNDATYPWVILVPEREGAREFHDLTPQDQTALMAEITHASKAMQDAFSAPKMNVAALGNMVPQLHIHVIARFTDDPAWPGPVWGKVPVRRYEAAELESVLNKVRTVLT